VSRLSTVLLIDDDSTTNYLHKHLLTTTMQVAARVLVAENGQEGLNQLAQACAAPVTDTCPQLILLDLNMPVMNGLEFLEVYARLPAAQRQSLVVLLTTSLPEGQHLLTQHLPLVDFVEKPLTRAKLTALLTRHFPGVGA